MSNKSKIEWTEATWNPVTGCNKVSQGCKNCYAERNWARLSRNPKTDYYLRKFTDIAVHFQRIEQPLNWKHPRRIFVNSMSDLFHASIPFEVIDEIFAVMTVSSQHIFQVLTKRPERMLEWSKVAFDSIPTVRCMELEQVGKSVQDVDYIEGQKNRWPWPLRNVWLGVSVENQRAADERIPLLLETPAAIRWISAEPLLGPVRLDWLGPDGSRHAGLNALTGEQRGPHEAPDESEWGDSRIDWVVAGGESGPDARPSHPDWFRGLRDQCQAAQVPFFFKQHGEWLHESQSGENLWAKFAESGTVRGNVGRHQEFGGYTYRVGKKAAGRELDGRTWDEYPK